MPYHLFQGGRRTRPRRWPRLLALAALVLAAAVAGALIGRAEDEPGDGDRAAPTRPAVVPPAALQDATPAPLAGGGTAPSPLAVRLDVPGDPIRLRFRHPPRSGLVFDLDTGRVLWRYRPARVLPIASLTKMMTALVVVSRIPRHGLVPITRQALHYQGSGVGLLPRGKRIPLRTMLYGLLLPSGNDAAIALAQRAAGTVGRFVALMNARARALGLTCTHFTSPSGFYDAGNHSCTPDLAALARALLRVRVLARVVRTREIALHFPIKGHRLYLYNNNPLLAQGYPGTTGVKTGYTVAAGQCLVATARRGSIQLGVILLHSPNSYDQARRLLDRGFRVER